ncbi:MmyB family transcriptional regulator [Sphaerisporangium perillae]|uniref:MmyB family transcriptional regulator n=1 Tax=Sphaerisporangium perillae TaxID=2935860 RepID=UPI00200D0868|nr:hypothetical protein [Sphaerisporangium perillae]
MFRRRARVQAAGSRQDEAPAAVRAQARPQRIMGVKRYNHPIVGRITLTYHTLALAEGPEQTLYVYTTEPGSPSAEGLRLLAKWIEEGNIPPVR